MKTVAERAARAYAETLDVTTSIQVCGAPSEVVLQMPSMDRPRFGRNVLRCVVDVSISEPAP
jgi:hypothetical protein